jgi:hypothetical protein
MRKHDCEYKGFDETKQKFIIHEQLYPENRGYLVHAFDSEQEMKRWLDNLDKDISSLNEKTRNAIKDAQQKQNLIDVPSIDDLFGKL